MHKDALQDTSALDALSSDSSNALTRVAIEEMAVEKEGEHALDRQVRVIHLICLLHHRIFLKNLSDTNKSK